MSGEGSAEKYSILSALQVMQASLLTLAFAEYYQLPWAKVVSVMVSPDKNLEPMLDDDIFTSLRQQLSIENQEGIQFNPAISSVVISNPAQWLNRLSGQTVCDKFPFFKDILNIDNYSDPHAQLEKSLLKRCRLMAVMWEEWGKDEGVPHLLSSLQALFRQVAAKMTNPFVLSLPPVIENGLSVEYQCEIYADQLYGAKLLDIWNHYLLSDNIQNRKLASFKYWLRDYPNDELIKKFGINKEKIPSVTYIREHSARLKWKFTISDGFISNAQLPAPQSALLEIIYVLRGDGTAMHFYGGIKERGTINHSSFFAGQKVDGAGRMILIPVIAPDGNKKWKISYVDNNSGHIKPDEAMSIKVLLALQAAGTNLDEITWRTKWGAPGLQGETAGLALRRMQKKSVNVDNEITLLHSPSLLLQKMVVLAKKGNLHDIYHFYLAQRHKINQHECMSFADAILSGLEYVIANSSVSHYERELMMKLADQVLKLMQKSGRCQLTILERAHYVKGRVMELDRKAEQKNKLFQGANDRHFFDENPDEHTPDFGG